MLIFFKESDYRKSARLGEGVTVMKFHKRPSLRILLLVALVSCGPQATPAARVFVTTPCEVVSGGKMPFAIDGTLPPGAQVTWEADRGTLSKTDGTQTTFTAPTVDQDTIVVVTAKITYAGGETILPSNCTVRQGSITSVPVTSNAPDSSTPPPVVPITQTATVASQVSSVAPECTLDLRTAIPTNITCSPQGALDVEGVGDIAMSSWIATLSRLIIPVGWRVIVYYETWLPPLYNSKDPSKEGFIALNEGEILLPSPGFKVYSDKNLTTVVKEVTLRDELNDKTQYLLIYPTTNSELVLSDNVSSPFGRELHLKYRP
jgi:hypothetical protein